MGSNIITNQMPKSVDSKRNQPSSFNTDSKKINLDLSQAAPLKSAAIKQSSESVTKEKNLKELGA